MFFNEKTLLFESDFDRKDLEIAQNYRKKTKKKGKTILPTWFSYASDIITGKSVSCPYAILAAERFYRDLLSCETRSDWRFNQDNAINVTRFAKNYCVWPTGEFAGKPVVFAPWQKFAIANVFGFEKYNAKREKWLRRFNIVFIEVPRKNGKTTFLSVLGLYMLTFDGEHGAECYSSGMTRNQAGLVFGLSHQIVKMSPRLRRMVNAKSQTLLSYTDPSSKAKNTFSKMSREHKNEDGGNVHFATCDEIKDWPKEDLYLMIENSAGGRLQPIIWSITYAGTNRNLIGRKLHNQLSGILKGTEKNDAFWGIIYDVGQDEPETPYWSAEDLKQEKFIQMSNPNYGISLDEDRIRNETITGLDSPLKIDETKRVRFNIWTGASTSFIDMDAWDKCGKEDVENMKLAGKTCFGGLDLSKKHDLSSLSLVFPPEWDDEDGKFIVLSRNWIPEKQIEERYQNDRVPYKEWREKELVYSCKGASTDFDMIYREIVYSKEVYNLHHVAIDQWGSRPIVSRLQDKYGKGFTTFFAQRPMNYTDVLNELTPSIENQRISHGGNEVLRWCASNFSVERDRNDNPIFFKNQVQERIDAFVSFMMAFDRALRYYTTKRRSNLSAIQNVS